MSDPTMVRATRAGQQAEGGGVQVPPGRSTSVDVVIPVLNEAHVLEQSVTTVLSFLEGQKQYEWRVVIVDNGSVDGTADVARTLQERHPQVGFLLLKERGRGRALRHAWTSGDADVVCYFDVDLSTQLSFLPSLIAAIADEGYDVATGSRLMRQSRTVRSFKREFISRAYNLFVKAVLRTSFSDAQCGFKAVSREVVRKIVPEVRDQGWFFDTELLVLAEKDSFRIKDLPVVWTEDDDSRVRILRTAWDDIKGVLRVRRTLSRRPARAAAPLPETRSTAGVASSTAG